MPLSSRRVRTHPAFPNKKRPSAPCPKPTKSRLARRAASPIAARPSLRRPSGCWRRSARSTSSTASRRVETPFVEYTDALGKFLPDQDRPNEGVFSFQDDDEQWLSLRYDLTAPLARYVAEHFDALPKPYRSYRGGWVFRNEKPGPGRFRQFMQFDADTVGAASVAADAEICMMAADTLDDARHLGRPVRHQGQQPQGARRRAGGDRARRRRPPAQRLAVLRAIDKLDRLGPDGVALLLGQGRKDESGDFTKGAGLAPGRDRARVAGLRGRAASAKTGAATIENLRSRS